MNKTVIAIKKQRLKLGLSVQNAATKANLSIFTWYAIENGNTTNPGIETIEKMRKVVGLK